MKKIFSVTYALAFAVLCLSACSNMFAGTSDDPNQVTASIKGVVEKGPFVKGTTVTLYELNPETFAQTGKVFTGSVDGDDGSFSLGKVELGSQYVLLEASGYYWNELWGENTENTLSLKAMARVSGNSKININIGTHITHKRILSLIESGMDFDEAKTQAESELVKAIFGDDSGVAFENASIFDNDKLLALSVMVLLAGPTSAVTEMIADLTAGITPELLLKLADKVAFQYDSYGSARTHMKEKYPEAHIGPFQAYIYSFWQKIYGLSECSEKTAGVLDTVQAENSVNDGKILVCKELVGGSGVYLWTVATDMDISVESMEPVEDGKLVKSKTDSTVMYVYDSGRWRKAYDDEINVGVGCVETADDSLLILNRGVMRCDWMYCIQTINNSTTGIPLDSFNFLCNPIDRPAWKFLYVSETPKELFLNNGIEYGSVTDSRDGNIYRTVDIVGKTWMAENLAYAIEGGSCANSSSVGCKYSWNTALKFSMGDSVINKQGICMDGWHVPDTTEWRELIDAYALTNLVSEIGWSFGDNETGLSLVPTSYDLKMHVSLSGAPMSDFAYLLVVSSVKNYALTIEDNDAHFSAMNYSKFVQDRNYSEGVVRCVKDSE